MTSKSSQTYAKRAQSTTNPLLAKLFSIAERKRSNIVLSADLTTTVDLLKTADGKFPSQPCSAINSPLKEFHPLENGSHLHVLL
jgi:hypothetical protein